MKLFSQILMCILFLMLVAACSTTVNNPKPNSKTTVGVLNKFPEQPRYIKQKTFVFRHQASDVQTTKFKTVITQTTKDYLVAKGYKVLEVQSKEALKDGSVDMIVEIVPRHVLKQEDRFGYGFSDRSFLLVIKNPPNSYVCLHLSLHRKDKAKIKKTDREESFSRLDIETLPDEVKDLTQEQKDMMFDNLKENITKTIHRMMPKLGFN